MTATTRTGPTSLESSGFDRNDFGTGAYYGNHLTATDLDGEILSRIEPSRLKGFAAFNETTWYGYRFASPGHRLMYFIHCYRETYAKTTRLMGKRFMRPAWMKSDFLVHMSKANFSCLLQAMATADEFGIPYEFYCEQLQDLHLRGRATAPLAPNQSYGQRGIEYALAKWNERNEAGIYTAKCDLLLAENYAGHPIQDAYMDYLCEAVRNKGNKAFYVSRLMFDIGHLTREHAIAAFGERTVDRAEDFK